MKKSIITIAGKLGSGKSTTAKKIAERLGYTHFSSGDFYREAAVARGMTVTELNQYAQTNPEVDFEIDEILRHKGEVLDSLVIDSRLAFRWILGSFKVYLDIDPLLAAQRMLKDRENNPERQASEKSNTLEEMVADAKMRLDSEKERYQKLYGIDHTDPKHFDLVIDTGSYTIDEVVNIILEAYKNWLTKKA
jgi:CMP/dCMP kinase